MVDKMPPIIVNARSYHAHDLH